MSRLQPKGRVWVEFGTDGVTVKQTLSGPILFDWSDVHEGYVSAQETVLELGLADISLCKEVLLKVNTMRSTYNVTVDGPQIQAVLDHLEAIGRSSKFCKR